MPNIGNLSIRLIALTDQFAVGMSAAKNELTSFSSLANSVAPALAQIKTGGVEVGHSLYFFKEAAMYAYMATRIFATRGIPLLYSVSFLPEIFTSVVRSLRTFGSALMSEGASHPFTALLAHLNSFPHSVGVRLRVAGAWFSWFGQHLTFTFSNLGQGFSHLGSGLANIAIGAGRAAFTITGSLVSALVQAAFAASALAIGLASMAAGLVTAIVLTSLRASMETIRLADALGIEAKQMGVLEEAARRAGIQQNVMRFWLEHFAQTIGRASSALLVMDRLGRRPTGPERIFPRLGLDANELANMNVYDAFKRVVDAINLLPPGAQRAAAAYELFGRSGADALKIINMGSKDLARIAKQMEENGQLLSEVDASKLRAANDALQQMHGLWRGIGIQLTVAIAPIVLGVTNLIRGQVADVGALRTTMHGIATTFIHVGSYLSWVFDLLKAIFFSLRTALDTIIYIVMWLLEKVGAIQKGMAEAFRQQGGAHAREMRDAWKALGDLPIDRATRAMTAYNKAMTGAIAQQQQFNAAQNAGQNNLAQFQLVAELAENAKRLTEHQMPPLRKLQAQMREYMTMLKLGLIDQVSYNTAVSSTFREAEKHSGIGESKLTAAMDVNSSQAISAIIQDKNRPDTDPQLRIEKFLAEQTSIQRITREYQKRMADALGNMKVMRL